MNHLQKKRLARKMFRPKYFINHLGKKVRQKKVGIFNSDAWNQRAEKIQQRVKRKEKIRKEAVEKKRKETIKNSNSYIL